MVTRATLLALCLGTFAIGCRPKQSDLDEVNAKLDRLAQTQEQLVANLDTSWAAERRGEGSGSGDEVSPAPRADLERRIGELEQDLNTYIALNDTLRDELAELRAQKAKAPKPTYAGRPDPKKRYRIELGNSAAKGPTSALVTLVAITDFQCPFCKRVQPTLKALKSANPNLRIVHKHNPLPMHNRAMAAAAAAEAAKRQGKFWEMHDKLFQDPRALTDENFEKYATELGLNLRRFKADMADPALEKRIKKEQSQGSKVGARGTPAFFINGRFLSGAQPQEAFQTLIDEERKAAKKMVKSGTKKRDVYRELMKTALDKV